MRYKITIYSKNIIKNICLDGKWENGLYIGTTPTSHMRFKKNLFPIDFELFISLKNGLWQAECSDSILLKNQNNISSKVHFDSVDRWCVIDKKNRDTLFDFEFVIDFESLTKDFNKQIDASNTIQLIVGGCREGNVVIDSPIIGVDYFTLNRSKDGWVIDTTNARYGVLINGISIKKRVNKINNRDFISINGFAFYWKNECLYTGSNISIITNLPLKICMQQSNHLEYPKFIRSVRQEFVVPEEKLNILQPINKPEQPKRNMVLTILPTLSSMFMMFFLRMSMGGNSLYIFIYILMIAVGVLTSVITYRYEDIDYKKNLVKRENDYNKYISEVELKIKQLQEKEKIISCEKYPSVSKRLQYVRQFDARLFEKQKEHKDFMTIRLGSGIVESKCQITYKEQEYRQVEDPLADYPMMISEKYKYIPDMPVILDLNKMNAVGFIGDRTHLYHMMKSLILQICIEHYYQDVKIAILMHDNDTKYFEWARWYKNTYDEKSGVRYLAYDEDSNKIVLEQLYSILNSRDGHKIEELKNEPVFIIFAYRADIVSSHPITNFVEKAAKLKCIFMFFEDYPEMLNRYCEKRVFLNQNDYTGYIQNARDGEDIQSFAYEKVSMDEALKSAIKMSSVYVEQVSSESKLRKNITLYELLDIKNVRELNLSYRWNTSKIYDSMAAPLGVKSGDEIVYLDLHERYHGPHGLVAGTTGSGKSEILQSYILSMATLFHPYEVGFIIIDFKGGGMANQFKKLPHLNGAITNIDGKEIDRSLSSIKAELNKRQRYFARYEVNHINDYIKLYKEKKAKEPLPHLILIVDEFAELKSEQPDFMKELISTARIGRSLGVHLILATQKPSGVVNEQIWSNSKFKLCLKVQDKSDSNEVLKSPLAANIVEPGRAYLQVGNNEIFELFQSAYSGAAVPDSSIGEVKAFKISQVELCGRRNVIYAKKGEKNDGAISQLDAIVEYIDDYCKQNNIQALQNICLPPLKTEIEYNYLPYETASTDICVPLGIYDAPERQAQEIMDVNFTQGHILIVGASQMGKTNVLQVFIRGIAERYSSDEVEIHILDYASMMLKNFQNLKCVGEVIISSDNDKPGLFLKNMINEINKRKDILSELGISSYSAYRESGKNDLKQIVIMIDNIGAFRDMYLEYDEELLTIAREGSSVGICLVVTAIQTSGLGFRYMSNFPKRIALYCNDSGEYLSIFERCRNSPDQNPGRCLICLEKNIYEGQIYIAFSAAREIDRVKEIRAFIESINEKDKGGGAGLIARVPGELTRQSLNEMLKEELQPYAIPIGVNHQTLEVDTINLADFNVLGICDSNNKYGQKFVKRIIDELFEREDEHPVNIYVFDDLSERLKEYRDKVCMYTTDEAMVDDVIVSICESVKDKQSYYPYECVIINSKRVLDILGEDNELYELCKQTLIEYSDKGISFIMSDLPNESIYENSSQFVKLLNNACNLLIFEQLSNIKITELGIGIENKFNKKTVKDEDAWFKCGSYFGLYRTPNL